jgi:cytochrome P450
MYAEIDELLRSLYKQESDMNSKVLTSLSYLQAILEESMRMYMPIPSTLSRKTPKQGEMSKPSPQWSHRPTDMSI